MLVVFALSLSNVDNRRSRVPTMIFAFVVYFAYANLIGFAVALMRKGEISAYTGVWYVHGAFALLAVYVFWRRVGNLPMIPRWLLPPYGHRKSGAASGT